MSIVSYQIGSRLEENRKCPSCIGKLHHHGQRRRIIKRGVNREVCFVMRYLCSICGRTITVLPSDAIPYKHYAASSIEAALQDRQYDDASAPVADSTLRHWKQLHNMWLLKAAYWLMIRYMQEKIHTTLLKDFAMQNIIDLIIKKKVRIMLH